MTAVDQWLKVAQTVYDGEALDELVDRTLRGKGETDRITFAYLTLVRQAEILSELRLIRRALQSGVKQR